MTKKSAVSSQQFSAFPRPSWCTWWSQTCWTRAPSGALQTWRWRVSKLPQQTGSSLPGWRSGDNTGDQADQQVKLKDGPTNPTIGHWVPNNDQKYIKIDIMFLLRYSPKTHTQAHELSFGNCDAGLDVFFSLWWPSHIPLSTPGINRSIGGSWPSARVIYT